MDKLINLNTYPVSENLKALLKDKTTKKNIIFATSVYSSKGTPIKETEQMTWIPAQENGKTCAQKTRIPIQICFM
jgi:uncharacterized membrane protein affecting hemolysin expression